MQEPTKEQIDRARAVASWAEAQLPRIWRFDEVTEPWTHQGMGYLRWRRGHEPRFGEDANEEEHLRYENAIRSARSVLGDETPIAFADYYFVPNACQTHRAFGRNFSTREELPQRLAVQVAGQFLSQRDDDYIFRLCLDRLRSFLLTPGTGRDLSVLSAGAAYVPPTVKDLTAWLGREDFPFDRDSDTCRELVQARWNAEVADDKAKSHGWSDTLSEHAYPLRPFVDRVMDYFHERDEFGYAEFARLMTAAPGLIRRSLASAGDEFLAKQEGLAFWRAAMTRQFAWDRLVASTTDPNADKILVRCAAQPWGGKWMLQAGRLIEARGLSKKELNDQAYGDLPHAVKQFLRLRGLELDETVEDAAEALSTLKEETLWLILPFAGAGTSAVLRALNAEALEPLHHWIEAEAPYIHNGESPRSGRVDCAVLAEHVRAPAPLLKRYYRAMRESRQEGPRRVIKLVQAFCDENREALEKGLKRHSQVELKAYGLLPIKSAEDLRERYLTLKERWKTASKYGAERQANTRAAAEVGLENLAERAGFRDATRMEWALEADIAKDGARFDAPVVIGPWLAAVELEGAKPKIAVTKGGKRLRAVPAKMRKEPAFLELKESVDRLAEQAARFRHTLEDMMANGEELPRDDVERLAMIPSMRELLAGLIGVNETDELGFIDPRTLELVDEDQRFTIGSSLRLAHVSDLFESRSLSKWQRRLVEESMVQPFKQAFREFYVLTPAERATVDHSNRFAGHDVRTSVAYRLLQSRGWQCPSGEGDVMAYKRFASHGLCARWCFPGVRRYFTEEETQSTGEISFSSEGRQWTLAEVPPVVLSEAMRDADLVVSVAHAGDGDSYWSSEMKQSRESVIRSVAPKLGLRRLTFDQSFVEFQGTLSRYKVHLLSGAVHLLPGGHICIIPEPTKKALRKVYLPFVEADHRTSEIIAKILLLQNDDKIKDESILAQIRRGLGEPTRV